MSEIAIDNLGNKVRIRVGSRVVEIGTVDGQPTERILEMLAELVSYWDDRVIRAIEQATKTE